MKVIKSLLLGSTAVVAGVAVAQAADLPSRKAAPAEYVKICDAYGAGFFYIPGTDTCLRVGGYVRAEYAWDQAVSAATPAAFKAAPTATQTGAAFVQPVGTALAIGGGNSIAIPSGVQDQTGFLGRGRLEMDARTQTPWGTARTFIALRAQATTGIYSSSDNYATLIANSPTPTAGSVTGQTGSTGVTVEQAIIQFAGFTFGRTTGEIFTFMPAPNYGSYANAGYPGAINILSYTAVFGGGFSGTIGIEDRSGQNYSANIGPGYLPTVVGSGIGNVTTMGAFQGNSASAVGGAVTNGPLTWPVLAGNVRFDQPWGAVQLMGRVQQNGVATNFNNSTIQSGSPNVALTATGWAIGAGLKLNLPMLAAGDTLYATAAYGSGDIDALTGWNTSASTSNIGRELGGMLRIDRDLYLTPSALAGAAGAGGLCGSNIGTQASSAATPATNASCFTTAQTTGWSVAAFFTHYWTPTLRSVLLASYINITPPNAAQNTDWSLGGLSKANEFRIGGQLVWSPVKDLDIGAEVQYMKLNASLTGQLGNAPVCTAGNPGNAASAIACNSLITTGALNPSPSAWQARLRVQRQF